MCNRNAASQSPKFELIYYFRFQNSEYFSVNNEKKMKCKRVKEKQKIMERERKTKRPRTRKYDTIINIFCHYFVQNCVCVCMRAYFSGKTRGTLNGNRNKPSYYDKKPYKSTSMCMIIIFS